MCTVSDSRGRDTLPPELTKVSAVMPNETKHYQIRFEDSEPVVAEAETAEFDHAANTLTLNRGDECVGVFRNVSAWWVDPNPF